MQILCMAWKWARDHGKTDVHDRRYFVSPQDIKCFSQQYKMKHRYTLFTNFIAKIRHDHTNTASSKRLKSIPKNQSLLIKKTWKCIIMLYLNNR